jgi:hypothetical protein
MPVSFTARDGKDPVQSVIDLFHSAKQPSPEQMKMAGDKQKQRIKERTAQGVDVNGQAFAPYSNRYAKIRAKRGLRVSPPDLRSSGGLLDSMETEVLNEKQFAIVVRNADANHYGPRINAMRHYFASSQNELKQMLQDLREVENS